MKILLISPPFKYFTRLYSYGFPTGLCILASIARSEGFDVSVCEMDKSIPTNNLNLSDEHLWLNRYIPSLNDIQNPAWKKLRKNLEFFQPDIVGITANTTTFASALRTAEITKEFDPGIVTILGGPHISARPQDCLKSSHIDFVVVGEGEIPFRQLIRILEKKENDFERVPGLGYKLNGKVRVNSSPDFIKDLDIMPDRDVLWYKGKYSPLDLGLLIASRGCPFGCTYCFHFWGKIVRYRSVGNVIEEIVSVKSKYGTDHFSFKDDTMTLNKNWVMSLCEQIKRRNIKITWECTTRPDVLDAQLLDVIISSGCKVIKIGVESGSPDVLARMNRNITKKKMIETVDLLRSRDIFWSSYFMYGLPFETEKDIENTCRFMKELKPDYAALGLYHVSPATELHEYGAKNGLYYLNPPLEHFFKTNPKDYYMLDPDKRSLFIAPQRFKALEHFINKAFDDYNTSIFRIFRRGWARRRIYLKRPLFLFKEIKMAFVWMVINRFNRLKKDNGR